jgi:hypothetical protein
MEPQLNQLKYFVITESRDNCELPLMPVALPLDECAKVITKRVSMWQLQGYYFNCKQERIPVGELCFRLVPELPG